MNRKVRRIQQVRFSKEAGVTLFEVMVAAGVTLVAIVAAMGSIVSIASTSTVSETQIMATTIISSVMEQLRTMPTSDVVAFDPPADLARRSGTAIQVTCFDTNGDGHQTPFDPSAAGVTLPSPLPVEVMVTWRDDHGRPYTKRSSALIPRR